MQIQGEEDSSGNLLLIKPIPGMGQKLIGGESFKQEYFQRKIAREGACSLTTCAL